MHSSKHWLSRRSQNWLNLFEKHEKMKPMLRETKENVQGTNSDEKETGTQINGVEKETSNQKRMKNQEFGKMRRGLGTSRTS